MVTYYKPVLDYGLSFDCDKGDKHKMEVHYFVKFDEDGNIGEHAQPLVTNLNPPRRW